MVISLDFVKPKMISMPQIMLLNRQPEASKKTVKIWEERVAKRFTAAVHGEKPSEGIPHDSKNGEQEEAHQ